MSLKKIKEQLKNDPWLKWLLPLFFSILVGFFLSSEPKTAEKKDEAAADMTTLIPKGFVLVPIELKNKDHILSVIGAFAVVDLYEGKESNKKGHRIARRLKLLRAPLNPEVFGVLVPEEQAADFIKGQTPFYAVLQNPNAPGFGSLDRPTKNLKTVEYYQ